jgi:hypothetical protein
MVLEMGLLPKEKLFRELVISDRKMGIRPVPRSTTDIKKIPIRIRNDLLTNYKFRIIDERFSEHFTT